MITRPREGPLSFASGIRVTGYGWPVSNVLRSTIGTYEIGGKKSTITVQQLKGLGIQVNQGE